LGNFLLKIDGCKGIKSPISYGISSSVVELMHCLKIEEFISASVPAAHTGLVLSSRVVEIGEDKDRAGDTGDALI
jgi:hypothetical protein